MEWGEVELVDLDGKSLNQMFDTLAQWNNYLEAECPEIYQEQLTEPKPQ